MAACQTIVHGSRWRISTKNLFPRGDNVENLSSILCREILGIHADCHIWTIFSASWISIPGLWRAWRHPPRCFVLLTILLPGNDYKQKISNEHMQIFHSYSRLAGILQRQTPHTVVFTQARIWAETQSKGTLPQKHNYSPPGMNFWGKQSFVGSQKLVLWENYSWTNPSMHGAHNVTCDSAFLSDNRLRSCQEREIFSGPICRCFKLPMLRAIYTE